MMQLAVLFLIPFFGTALGSSCVLFLRNGLSLKAEKIVTGFASGVMLAALVWSLLLPAIETSTYFHAAFGFILGIGFLLALDRLVPHQHATEENPEGRKSENLTRVSLLLLSVTIHNIPEGMAVGAGAAALTGSGVTVSYASALALSLGIALQNFPEGMVVSFPLYKAGKSKLRAFWEGLLSGAVEPLGSVVAYVFARHVGAVLPVFLSFAAGAMFYVVVEELIPEASEGEHSDLGTIGAAAGFVAMMLLDGIFS